MKIIMLRMSMFMLMVSCANPGSPIENWNPQETEPTNSELGESIDLGYARKIADISYHAEPVSEPRYNKLDVYFQNTTERRPVVMYVHGGGWAGPEVIDGDKSNIEKNEQFPKSLLEKGYVIASINRRALNMQLSATGANSDKVTYEEQAVDVARAVKWISLNAEKFGGDSTRIVLLGFSSGAHLVALTATNKRYFQEQKINQGTVKAVISVDFHAYDIPLAIRLMAGTSLEQEINALKTIFGKTETEQKKASPSEYVSDSVTPPMLLFSAGFKDGSPQDVSNLGSSAFKDKLLSVKRICQHHHFEDKDHTQRILDFGTQKDDGFSSALFSFLNDKLAPRAIESIPETLKTTISNIVRPLVDSTGAEVTKSPGFAVGIVSPKYSEVLGFGTKKIGTTLKPDGDTFYGIGSVSKIFTGIMLAQEVVSKRMDPKKSLFSYLKDPIKSALSSTITLEQAISHHSGLLSYPENVEAFRDEDGDKIGDSVDWSPATNYERKHLLACLQGGGCRPNSAKVGTYVYSNLGIGLVSLTLEDNLGASSFDELLKINFSRSLGMDDTGTNTPAFIENTTSRKAQGYRADTSSLEPLPFSDMGFMAGSGEIISTANNMNSLLEHLVGLRESYLKEAIGLAMKPLNSVGPEQTIGYAIDIMKDQTGTTFYSKPGATRSSQAYLIWRNDLKIGVVVLSNSGSGKVKAIGSAVINAIANP
ncbi:MAG: serine hydrolase [Bdellovibrionales bacterium]|nr:serine hydrolase [Bdellovibrionales bacterium]